MHLVLLSWFASDTFYPCNICGEVSVHLYGEEQVYKSCLMTEFCSIVLRILIVF